MNKYKENTIYEGNLITYINGSKKIIKKTFLIYSEKEDSFIDLIEALNPSLDLLNPDIKNKEEIENNINSHKYPYKNNGINNTVIVDEESLVIKVENKKKGR